MSIIYEISYLNYNLTLIHFSISETLRNKNKIDKIENF